jgi:hypothetical protein
MRNACTLVKTSAGQGRWWPNSVGARLQRHDYIGWRNAVSDRNWGEAEDHQTIYWLLHRLSAMRRRWSSFAPPKPRAGFVAALGSIVLTYATGMKITPEQKAQLSLTPHRVLPKWHRKDTLNRFSSSQLSVIFLFVRSEYLLPLFENSDIIEDVQVICSNRQL